MIPKKDGMSKDPEKYRPISLIRCLGKMVERLIKKRLYDLLEKNNIIVKQKSGFRNEKGAAEILCSLLKSYCHLRTMGWQFCHWERCSELRCR